jgi:hypothetical protein
VSSQYRNNSNLPHKDGLSGLFVKVLDDEGCPHFPADDVQGGECPLSRETQQLRYLIRGVVSVVSS